MNKNSTIEGRDLADVLRSFDGDAGGYRRVFEAISQEIPCAQVLLISTFPRGGTQILQPAHYPEGLLRAYTRGLFLEDGPTWRALLGRTPVTSNEASAGGNLEESAYFREFMQPLGWGHIAAARVSGPLFKGYPGAIHLYRRTGEAAFSPHELRRLGELAEPLAAAIKRAREARTGSSCGPTAPWDRLRQGDCRQFIFDRRGRQIPIYGKTTPMDDRLKQSIQQLVSNRMSEVNGQEAVAGRVDLPDNHGELWAFHSVLFREFPALGSGPYLFLCAQPPACEWNAVRNVDLQADPEITRLLPTLKFMHQEFHRGPTLNEIAAKAHLSQFHFHRRFTESLGMTPKHFLLACQIHEAKKMLVERKAPLTEIASVCGFAHQSHFTSRFKQATGLTPTRWRRFALDQQNAPDAATPAIGCLV